MCALLTFVHTLSRIDVAWFMSEQRGSIRRMCRDLEALGCEVTLRVELRGDDQVEFTVGWIEW